MWLFKKKITNHINRIDNKHYIPQWEEKRLGYTLVFNNGDKIKWTDEQKDKFIDEICNILWKIDNEHN